MGYYDEVNCCGLCKYHKRDNTHGWYCNNELSMYYTDQTEYKDVCGDFERRENAKPKQW